MNLLVQLKRRFLQVLLALTCCLFLAGALLYFLVVYRCKDTVKYIINKECKGSYSFDASEVTVSLWPGSIRLKNSSLSAMDTAGSDLYFNVHIPEIYFSLASWKELIVHKKILIDSLSIVEPLIEVHTRKIPALKASAVQRPSDILNYLKKALDHFNVHSFSLKDAAFRYERRNTLFPLHGDHINLSIANFAEINNEDSHLLGSDKVSLSLGHQRWTLPDGKHEVEFSRLSFDSKGQRFELDSFYFLQRADTGKTFISIRADQFFFSSHHLPAIYQKEQLLLDSLICINPVLSFPGRNANTGAKDTGSHLKSDLFNFINAQYISVIDGELLLQDKDGRTGNATTQKANLDIYNLSIRPAADPALVTDSIRVRLKKLEFPTPDSLYKLTIGDFTLRRNDAVFSDVRFGPSTSSISDKRVEFTAPSLLLKNISLGDLIQRRIVATGAELKHPVITMYDHRREAAVSSTRGPMASARQLALFYRALHHVNDLIHAGDFYITDGSARYFLTGGVPVKAGLEHLDAHILLNKLFISDSLVDIKHAIPDLRIGYMDLVSGKTSILVRGFLFDGVRQRTLHQLVKISTADGLELTAENVFWNILDWDAYQEHRDIYFDSLYASRCSLHLTPHPSSRPAPDLPGIRINKIQVDDLVFNDSIRHAPLRLNISRLHAEMLRSVGHFFTWQRLNLHLHDLSVGNVTIGDIDFDSNKELLIKDLAFGSVNGQARVQVTIPWLQLQGSCPSTDLSRLSIETLTSGDAAVSFTKNSARDTLKAVATVNIRAGSLVLAPKDKGLLAHTLSIRWKDTRFSYHKDGMSLLLKDAAGSFQTDSFLLAPAVRIDPRRMIAGLTLDKGSFSYKGKTITAYAGALSWHPSDSSLQADQFTVTPNESRELTFSKSQWQRDYITVQGNKAVLTGIRFQPDRLFPARASRVILDGVSLQASRDKHMPFQHGIEKLMPTRLISAIPFPIRVDTLSIRTGNVVYNERSVLTGRWSSVAIEDLNGSILHLGSRDNEKDTLQLFATARLFDGHIRDFSYQEVYGDSLSSFAAASRFSALDLTQFSQVSIPAAALSVTGGHVDTSWSSWQGNKYATFGTMNLFYDRLRIKVLNRKDSTKRGFLPLLETWAANLILPDHRKKTSVIFFERDREKFVFNYWVKAQVSGVLSTLNIKSSNSYRRTYQKNYQLYSLPIRYADFSPDWPTPLLPPGN